VSSGIVESSGESQSGASTAQGQGISRSKLLQRLQAQSANLPAFIHDLLTAQAVYVAGTEAAGFLIEKHEGKFSLRPIAHIRPDNSDQATRTAAIEAFQEIVAPCVDQSKDGAFEVGTPDGSSEAQYCLVTLLRNEGEVAAVSAVITRCRDIERAQQRLMSM